MNRFLTFDPIRYQMSQSERARLLQHQQQAAAFAHQQTRQQQPQQTSMNGFDRPRTPSQPGLAEMEGAHQLQSGDTRDDSGGGCLSRFFNCCPDRIDSFFRITERESSIAQEMRAGAVTFVTMAYILIVNAQVR
jgi:hypothetical protein